MTTILKTSLQCTSFATGRSTCPSLNHQSISKHFGDHSNFAQKMNNGLNVLEGQEPRQGQKLPQNYEGVSFLTNTKKIFQQPQKSDGNEIHRCVKSWLRRVEDPKYALESEREFARRRKKVEADGQRD